MPEWKLTNYEIARSITGNEDQGLCRNCGSVQENVEPDACNYKCEACGKNEVFGLEELLLMGEIEL